MKSSLSSNFLLFISHTSKLMWIHHLQHVPFEGLGCMEPYLRSQDCQLSSTHLYREVDLPDPNEIDCLIVMGGPMGVYDESEYPWLREEKAFIKEVIENGKVVLGICLGAQLIAEVLGAKVAKGNHREIGWFPIDRSEKTSSTILDPILPPTLDVFHWHGDTFEIPRGAVPLASSEACRNQGFIFGDRVLAFQFHLETTPASAKALIENCSNELDGSRFVQSGEFMLADPSKFDRINEVMRAILKKMLEPSSRT